MKRKNEFAILRLTPDEARGETINIGLIVFHDRSTDVRIMPAMQKIKSLDPNLPADFLKSFQEDIGNLFVDDASVEDRHSVLSNFPVVSATELGYFMLDETEDYETEIQKLLKHFVYSPRKISTRAFRAHSRIQSDLKGMFKQAGILGKTEQDIDEHKVIPNFLISPKENLRADFALKNSRWHISETIDFRVSEERLKENKVHLASTKAVTLDRASALLGNSGVVPVLIYAAYPQHEEIIEPTIHMLNNYADHVIDITNESQKAKYFEHMLAAAGVPQIHHTP